MKVKFVCRTAKKTKDGLVPIEVSVTNKGVRKVLSTGRKINPKKFSQKSETVKGDDGLNEYLSAIRSRLYSIETYLIQNGITVTTDAVIDIFRNGEKEKTITFIQLFEKHNADVKKKLKQGIVCSATLQKYENLKRHVSNFIKQELHKDDILVQDITPNMVENLFVFLMKSMVHNTAVHRMKLVKKILRLAVDEGYIKVLPFKMTLKQEKVEVIPLTTDEVNAIKDKKLTIPRLEKIRDLFIFECFTGLAFSDLMSLEENDFITDENGQIWILKKRHKTNIVATIPLLPIAKEILDKYNGVLPKISNVKYNAYLKELQDICGISKNLHSHLARHTMATYLLNNAGFDMVLVAKVLGHANSRITEAVYAKVLPSTICKKLKNIEGA